MGAGGDGSDIATSASDPFGSDAPSRAGGRAVDASRIAGSPGPDRSSPTGPSAITPGAGPAETEASAASAPPTIPALATRFGLDPDGAEEIRAASRHVVRFPASRVLTVASVGDEAGPRREAAVAALLAEAGVPATRCLAGAVDLDGWMVTAWREVVPSDAEAKADAATLGGLAAEFHRATEGLDPRGVVACDPVGAAREQLAGAVDVGATSEEEIGVLRRHAARLEDVWQAALSAAAANGDDLRTGAVVHGDLHVDNVVVGRDGPIAIDLELAGWGPRAYDAAPTVAFVRWYGRPASDLAAFDDTYGAPLTGMARELGLDEVWGLWSAAWAVANRHRSPEAEDEAAVRLSTLATGDLPRPWRLR